WGQVAALEEAGEREPRDARRYGSGLEDDLDRPLLLGLELRVGLGRLIEGQPVRHEVVETEDVVIPLKEGQDLGDPALDVRLSHADLHALVEQVEHRQRVGGAAIHPDDRQRSAPAHGIDGGPQGRHPVNAGAAGQRLAPPPGPAPGGPVRWTPGRGAPRRPRSAAVRSRRAGRASGSLTARGSAAAARCMAAATGAPWASMPTASTTPSGPRPPVRSRSASAGSLAVVVSMVSAPCRWAMARRSGTRSMPNTRSTPR